MLDVFIHMCCCAITLFAIYSSLVIFIIFHSFLPFSIYLHHFLSLLFFNGIYYFLLIPTNYPFVYNFLLISTNFYCFLGLHGGAARLPSLAFNSKNNLQITFPEELPINKETLVLFCSNYITGKLKSDVDTKEMSKKILQSIQPISQKNQIKRKNKSVLDVPMVKGVSEKYSDENDEDSSIRIVTLKNYQEAVMNDERDVVLMIHKEGSELICF